MDWNNFLMAHTNFSRLFQGYLWKLAILFKIYFFPKTTWKFGANDTQRWSRQHCTFAWRSNWQAHAITPWNNENVRLFGLRISIFGNYLGGVRISNLFFRPIYFGGSNFRVRILFLANYLLHVRISNFEFRKYLRKNHCPFCWCCPAGGLDFEKSCFFIFNVFHPSVKTAWFGWIWASGVC